MKPNRRDFLKGLLGLAGVAAIGLPDLERIEAEPGIIEVPQRLTKPVGHLGSLYIDGNWYALHDASIEVEYQRIPIVRQGYLVDHRHSSDMACWTATCLLDTVEGIDIYSPLEREIEVDTGVWIFSGQVVVSDYNFSLVANRSPKAEHELILFSTGPLKRTV